MNRVIDSNVWASPTEKAEQDKQIEATRQQIASTPGCQCVTMPVGYGTKDMEVQVYTYKCDLHRS